MIDGTKLVAMIDDEKLNEFNELFGYSQTVTSETVTENREFIAKCRGLTQTEDRFREMKPAPGASRQRQSSLCQP